LGGSQKVDISSDFFIFSLIVCAMALNKMAYLSKLYFKQGLLKQLGDYRDWHLLAAGDMIFVSLGAIFITVFITLAKFVARISKPGDELKDDHPGNSLPVDTDDGNVSPTYFINLFNSFKDLILAIKGGGLISIR